MIRTSTAAVAWPVPGFPDTHFMIRAGDVIERGELEADLTELGADRVYDFQLKEAFEAGVAALLKDSPEDAERVLGIAAMVEEEAILPPEDRALLDTAIAAVQTHWPAYRALKKQAALRNELIPTLAFQRFCSDWKGKDLPAPKKGMDGRVTLEVMQEIPSYLLRAAGMRAYQLLWTVGSAGNSARPLQSDKSPPPSTSDTSPADGTSAG
jgi:hypothetical protein